MNVIMKKGFILIELLVALIVSTVALGMIFSLYNLFNNIDRDGREAARATYNVNTIKEIMIKNIDGNYSIENKQLICDGDVILNLDFDGSIDCYKDDGFKRCSITYNDEKLDFVLYEVEQYEL